MDKHDRRYLFEIHGHSHEGVTMGEVMDYMMQEEADPAYLSQIIHDEFTGDQQLYLKTKLWDKQFGRD